MADSDSGAQLFHLHIDNDSALGRVFEVTPERLDAVMERFPDVAERLRVTIAYDGDDYDRHMATAEALLCWKPPLEDFAQRAPKVRIVHASGAGIEYFVPFTWLPEGVAFINNRGVHGERANEYAIMAVLMLNNRVPEMVTSQREGRWRQAFNTSVSGKTLLVVGVGSVGGGVATWAKRFGMRVIGVRRSGQPHDSVDEMHKPDNLAELVARADFVICTAPATSASRALIGAKEIAAMRPGCGIVNYSRAQVMDYEALRQRLERREVSAILDVFDPEPLEEDSPLWQTPNLIITPHCSSDDTEAYIPKTLDLMFGNLRRHFRGEALVNRVDPKLEY